MTKNTTLSQLINQYFSWQEVTIIRYFHSCKSLRNCKSKRDLIFYYDQAPNEFELEFANLLALRGKHVPFKKPQVDNRRKLIITTYVLTQLIINN